MMIDPMCSILCRRAIFLFSPVIIRGVFINLFFNRFFCPNMNQMFHSLGWQVSHQMIIFIIRILYYTELIEMMVPGPMLFFKWSQRHKMVNFNVSNST